MGQNGKADPTPLNAAAPSLEWPKLRGVAAAFCCAVLLTACSASAQQSDMNGEDATPLTRNTAPAGYPQPASTGTAVGQKVQQLRSDLSSLQSAVASQASQLDALRRSTSATAADYFAATAAIDAKLQVGTTKGNPILVGQLNEAQGKLDALGQDLSSYNGLSTAAAQSASQAAFILQSVRATYDLSGAVDEDHVALGALEDDANGEMVKIDRLLNGISSDLSRQNTYVATERRNLQTLALAVDNGEMYGQSLANRSFAPASLPTTGSVSVKTAKSAEKESAGVLQGRPLVVIRFGTDSVDYQSAVYQAVSQALDRYPQASFTVMAVSPTGANAAEGALATSDAQHNASGVARTLSQMGVGASRVHLAQATSPGITATEVRIYVR